MRLLRCMSDSDRFVELPCAVQAIQSCPQCSVLVTIIRRELVRDGIAEFAVLGNDGRIRRGGICRIGK